MRAAPAALAALLACGAVAWTGAGSSAAGTSCTPAVAVTKGSSTTLADGVTSTTYAGAGVTFRVVRADLTRAHLAVLSTGATGDALVKDLVAKQQPGAVAAVNGDFFHVSSDSVSVTTDGVQIVGGRLVKGGAGEADGFQVTGTAGGVYAPRFAGSVTISDTPASTSQQLAAAAYGTAAVATTTRTVRVPHQSPHEDRAPATPTPVHRTVTVDVAHPVTPPPATVTVTPPDPGSPDSPPAPAQATVKLIGVNNTDGGSTAIVLTPDWGTGSVAQSIDPASTEYVVQNGAVVKILSAAQAIRPGSGQVAVVLRPEVTKQIPFTLAVGDTVGVTTTLGGSPDAAIGGNAVLVRAGTADPGCAVGADTSTRPRVAVGSAGAGTVVLAVSDGDVSGEPGLTPAQWAVALQQVGVTDALDLDGGQSATLLQGKAGSLRQVNIGQPGSDRQVPDGLAVVPGS